MKTQALLPERHRVYAISTGAVSPYGVSSDELWQGAVRGEVAISEVVHLDTSGYSTRLGGEVTSSIEPSPVAASLDGFRDRSYDFMFAAARDAILQYAEAFSEVFPERRGLVLGTCNGGMLSSSQWFANREASSPRLPLYSTPQAMAEALAAQYDIRGPVLTINTACAAGANALGLAAELIAYGESDLVLMGGSDGLADLSYAGFNCLGSLSPRPAAPYSLERDGLSLGEGSGMILLVSGKVLSRLGLEPLAEVRGYGLSADGFHPTAPRPDGSGAARAIRAALQDAGLSSHDVDYINSHGTGTPKNDTAEANATVAAIPEARERTPVSSTKSLIGHLLGAAGAVEAVVAIHALREQVVPPTANLKEVDPQCELRHVPQQAEERPLKVAVSNNFAFAGANASVVLSLPDGYGDPPRRPMRRVVITGLGALTRTGRGVKSLVGGVSPDQTGSQPDSDSALFPGTHPYVQDRQLRRMDRLSSHTVLVAGDALRDAGFSVGAGTQHEETGVIFGTGVGPMEAMEKFYAPVLRNGASAANPAVYPNLVYNAAAGAIAMHLQVTGPTSTITTGHAAGASAVAYAADHIAFARAEAMLAAGCDTLTPTIQEAYRGLGVPLGDGNVELADGAGGLLLESEERAAARGITPYAVIRSHATTSDALGAGLWDQRGEGMERSMRRALKLAGVSPREIDVVWTADAGWALLDRAEERALVRLFGEEKPACRSIRAQAGEAMGGSAALRIAAAAHELFTRGYRYALVNSTSWGGTHVCVLLAAYRPA